MEEVEERRAEGFTELCHILAALEIRLAGDDRDHPQVARVVCIRQRLDGLVQLLVRLGVCRDEGNVPELTGIRDRLLQGKQPLQAALLSDEAQNLAPSALGGQLVAGSVQFSGANLDALDQVGQLATASLRVGQRKGPLPPVDREHASNPPERHCNTDGQNHGPVEPVEVEAQNEDAEEYRIEDRERDHCQDQKPGHQTWNDLQDSTRELPSGLLGRDFCLRDRKTSRGVSRFLLTHSCRQA